VNNLYNKNYKTLMKEIEEDRQKGNCISHSWIERLNVIKMSILPKVIYRCSVILIKIPMTFFIEIGKNSQNLYGTTKGPE
jgi:hypothetical protein